MSIRTRDLTEGVIWQQLLYFTIPLILTNLLQQAYNTADLLIVGNLSDDNAMAAIGATGSLTFMLLGVFMGFAVGSSIVVAHAQGARDPKKMHRAVHTTYAVAILSGAILTVLAFIFVPAILRLMGTPATIFDEAVSYTRIYFAGSIPLLIYNMGTGILRSVGDSKSPLVYLIISSILNIILDIIFVGPLQMRATGAAIATLISQIVTTVLLTRNLMKVEGYHRLILSKIRIYREEFVEIVQVGVPAGIQNALISFSNVLIQSRVNSFGEKAIAGVSAANRYDAFMGVGLQSMAMAATTFTGQNFGAKKIDRLKSGAKTAAFMGALFSFTVGLLLIIYGEPLMGLFSSDPEIIDFGYRKMVILARFHWIFTLGQILAGVIRGVGQSFVPMAISLFSMVGVRTFWNYVVPDILAMVPGFEAFARDIDLVSWSYPVSWTFTFLITALYYKFGPWLNNAIEKERKRRGEAYNPDEQLANENAS